MSKVVLVLSGGGAKALAHAGAFRALEQASLIPSHIVATSMGAVIGAAIGRQFGSGSGRDLATAAGAVAGGVIGHEIAK